MAGLEKRRGGAQDLTAGKPFPVLLRFTVPVLCGNLFQLFYTLADSVIVGRTLGADALAAVGATSSIVYLVLCFIQGLTGGFGILLGQRCGARDEAGMRRSMAVSWVLSGLFTVLITVLSCGLAHPILEWMQTPESICGQAYDYMFVVLLGTGASVFYNMISNMQRALGDSRTPLVFLVLSSLLNILLDIVCIVPLGMGVAGAAWATVLSQLISAALSLAAGLRAFPVMRLRRKDFARPIREAAVHLRIGFLMGFQMSVMCIGQLAMQAAVNALGPAAIAGYTSATKVNQVSVLVNNAFGIAVSNFTAQNFGAGRIDRLRQGVRAGVLQAEAANLVMAAALLLCRDAVVPLFIDQPTAEIIRYSSEFLTAVAPFFLVLGLLLVYRSAVQSMGNSAAPFAACVVELVMRIGGTFGLTRLWGYTGVCLASPLAWIGAAALLLPVYWREIRKTHP